MVQSLGPWKKPECKIKGMKSHSSTCFFPFQKMRWSCSWFKFNLTVNMFLVRLAITKINHLYFDKHMPADIGIRQQWRCHAQPLAIFSFVIVIVIVVHFLFFATSSSSPKPEPRTFLVGAAATPLALSSSSSSSSSSCQPAPDPGGKSDEEEEESVPDENTFSEATFQSRL